MLAMTPAATLLRTRTLPQRVTLPRTAALLRRATSPWKVTLMNVGNFAK